jgi:arylsulfatase A-like enzyme
MNKEHITKFLFVLTFVVSCISAHAKDKPNILWITHEDLSPIYGCYGDEYAHTPNIDKLAETGIRFSNAYSNAPICAPARSTLITGMYATSLGTQHLRSDIPVPEKYKSWIENLSAPVTDRMVGFVDFAPTVINLAGAEFPDMMEGRNFLGKGSEPKKYIFGYRDRADDCYDMSRAVTDGRYLYVRHFMPQLPSQTDRGESSTFGAGN